MSPNPSEKSESDVSEDKIAVSARPIVFDTNKWTLVGLCWLISLTVLIVVSLFRSSAPQEFRAASIDAERVISQARAYLRQKSEYPEFVEIELMQFIGYIQIELDDLIVRDDVSVVVASDVVLAGDAADYTDYIYLHAKEAYEDSVALKAEPQEAAGLATGPLKGVLR